VRLMIGSGDVKLAKVAGRLRNSTDNIGFLALALLFALAGESRDSLALTEFERQVLFRLETDGLFRTKLGSSREEVLAIQLESLVARLVNFDTFHLELPTESCAIVRSAKNGGFVRIDVLSDFVGVLVAQHGSDGRLDERNTGVTSKQNHRGHVVERETGVGQCVGERTRKEVERRGEGFFQLLSGQLRLVVDIVEQ